MGHRLTSGHLPPLRRGGIVAIVGRMAVHYAVTVIPLIGAFDALSGDRVVTCPPRRVRVRVLSLCLWR